MPDIPPVHNTYLAFFHFEQTDTVAEKLQIFFGPLASDLGSTELLVQRLVIVLLIWRQVHLVVLDIAAVVLHAIIVHLAHAVGVIVVRILVVLCLELAIITVKV